MLLLSSNCRARFGYLQSYYLLIPAHIVIYYTPNPVSVNYLCHEMPLNDHRIMRQAKLYGWFHLRPETLTKFKKPLET